MSFEFSPVSVVIYSFIGSTKVIGFASVHPSDPVMIPVLVLGSDADVRMSMVS